MASNTSTSPDLSRDAKAFTIWREIGGILILAAGLCILLALISFNAADLEASGPTANLIGPVGAHVGDALLYLFGVAAFSFDALLLYLGFNLLVGRHVDWAWGQIVGHGLFVGASTVLAHLAFSQYLILEHEPGGLVGAFSGEILRGLFGTVGASIIGSAFLLLGITLATRISIGAALRGGLQQLHRFKAWVVHKWNVHREYRRKLKEERRKLQDISDQLVDQAARAEAELEAADLIGEVDFDERFDDEVADKLSEKLAGMLRDRLDDLDQADPPASGSESDDSSNATTDDASDGNTGGDDSDDSESSADESVETSDDWEMGDGPDTEDEVQEPEIVVHDSDSPSDEPPPPPENAPGNTIEVSDSDVIDMEAEREPSGDVETDFGPEIVEPEAQKESREKKDQLEDDDGMLFKPEQKGNFELPPLNILNYETDDLGIDADALREMATEIEETLTDFKIEGSVVEICPGPVITMFEFKPAPGTKISKIANRDDDLAMNLAAQSVRIVAPIPGKSVVGIEVSNPEREMVWLKEILADDSFQDSDKKLHLALGKGTAGEVETADLADMPHLLVAGATGSGKSVAVNSMICSLLYTFTPDELQMIMIDPKVLEFSVYNGIPHLHLPVVTDPKQATVALNWAVQEMEKRYEKLADMGVRNVRSYNDKVAELTEQAREDQREGKEESEALSKLGVDADGEPKHTHLPYLVVVIDEFADLMMTSSKEVESAVARLAQKARAAGIHMILATQRPSTDVITGMIKANFPARIALRVTSNTDSRVILGDNGAENLLGNGDMLLMPPGSSDLERVHGCFVSDEEIEEVVDHVTEQQEPEYDESIIEEEDDGEEGSPLDREMEKDEYYEDAVRLVVEKDKCSISMIQRKLRVGYNRAARMVEMMEEQNLVGASDGCTARDVLIDEVPFDEDDEE
ncbi:MAG: DNA translocase FtsK [Bradymonadaceae bacterium]